MHLKLWTAAALLLCLLAAPATYGRERGEDDLRRDMEFARQQVFPALVNISVLVKGYGGGRSQRFPAAGSGVIVSPAGHVITNYHVAGNTTRIVCNLPSKESIEAEVVAHDPLTDITILKLKLGKRKDPNQPIPFARIGNSDELRTGDYVLAMGNPLTLSSSMTLGIIGNPKRVFTSFTGSDMDQLDLGEGQLTGTFTQWVQHDAVIMGGNSGGPLVNLRGEVIGINELKIGDAAFAIPSNLASHVLNQALTHGEIIRGWLGVTLYPVEKMGLDEGVLIASVQRGGPAAEAGFEPGDILLALDDEPVSALHLEEVPPIYKRFADIVPGSTVTAVVHRDGEGTKTLDVNVRRMEKYLADVNEVRVLGLTVRDITGPMALMRRYPDSNGVLITGTRPGFPADAAKPRLQGGDVITAYGDAEVNDYEAFRAQIEKVGRKEEVLVRYRRRDEEMVTVFDTSVKKQPFSGGELPKAWIGLKTQVLTTEVAKALGLGKTRGYRITQVYPGTKAEEAGLAVGDVITALNGEALRAYREQDAEMLRRRVENLVIGEKARLTVLGESGEREVEVVLEETPQTAAEVKTAEDDLLEYKVRGITFSDRVRRHWPQDQQGVIVTEVTSGGWAYLAGLRSGDLILRIDGEQVAGVKDFKKTAKRIGKEQPGLVTIFVVRGYQTAFVFAQPEYD